jgi:purine catabolism regulator
LIRQLTLRDVLAQESLGLRLVTPATAAVLDRGIIGAHGTETPHPVPWLQRDWVVLITGVRLVGSPQRQRTLVRELSEGNLAALGFGVGIDFDSVPEAIVVEARLRDFPVFEVPLATPFREIVAFVNRSLLSDDLHAMRRLTSMREFLVDSLHDQDPQAQIVQRLGSLLDSRVAVFSPDGDLEAGGRHVDADELWQEVRGIRRNGRSGNVLAVPIVDRDQSRSWLAVGLSSRRTSEAYARPLVETAALLLGGLAGIRRVTRSLERSVQAAFIRDLIEERDADSAAVQRAAALGLDLVVPARGVAVTLPSEFGPEGAERALSGAETVFQVAGLPAVLGARDGRIAALVQAGEGEDALGLALEAVTARLPGAAIGVGRPASSVSSLRSSLLDAELGLQASRWRTGRPEPGLHWFEDFDLVSWLVAAGDRDALRHKAAATFGDLFDDDVLMPTLETFLDHRLSVVRSAKTLNLHPNSLRYRLARIEERLGVQLDDPDTLTALQLARRVLDR